MSRRILLLAGVFLVLAAVTVLATATVAAQAVDIVRSVLPEEAAEALPFAEGLPFADVTISSGHLSLAHPMGELQADPGALIVGVFAEGAAAEAGLRRGDVLLQVDGQAVDDIVDVASALEDKAPGDVVSLRLRHGDEERDVDVTLGEAEGNAVLGVMLHAQQPMAMSVSVHDIHGAFIDTVVADGPADRAGLAEGDRITAVDGRALGPDFDLAAAIAGNAPGDTVALSVAEGLAADDDASRDVAVTLGSHPDDPERAYLGVTFIAFSSVERSSDGADMMHRLFRFKGDDAEGGIEWHGEPGLEILKKFHGGDEGHEPGKIRMIVPFGHGDGSDGDGDGVDIEILPGQPVRRYLKQGPATDSV